MSGYSNTPIIRHAHFSIPSILAIVCAIWGWFAAKPGLALLLCIAAALFGAIGLVLALLPSIRGGLISILSIVMGLFGLIFAVIRLLAS